MTVQFNAIGNVTLNGARVYDYGTLDGLEITGSDFKDIAKKFAELCKSSNENASYYEPILLSGN